MTPFRHLRHRTLFAVGSLISVGLAHSAYSQPNYATPYHFITLAGSAAEGSADGTGANATFKGPTGLVVDAIGNVYVADAVNRRIRKITPAGVVTTLNGPNGGPLNLDLMGGIALDGSGNLYVTAPLSNTILKITQAGVVSTFAGLSNTAGSADGVGMAARFRSPLGLVVDANGTVFVTDYNNHTIRQISALGVVSTLAGLAGTRGNANGTGTGATFDSPHGIGLDSAGNLLVADSGNHLVRKVTANGVVSTFAGTADVFGSLDAQGTAARFNQPSGLAVDSTDNVYVGEAGSATIRKITRVGLVTTLAGTPFQTGSIDGLGAAARFQTPQGLAVDSAGTVYVADFGKHTIRRSVAYPIVTFQSGLAMIEPGRSIAINATVTSDYPVSIVWRKNGAIIPGATTATFSISNIQAADSGTYGITVSNAAGTGTAFMTLSVVVPPVITAQPQNRTVFAGTSAQFSVTVTPSVGPAFLWRRNGVPIAGATNAVYQKNVTQTDAGQYSVVVTHAGVSVTSNNAFLTVLAPATITAPPGQIANAGATVVFVATFTPPSATIHWRRNGVTIPGATTATLTLTNVTAADGGRYEVEATELGSSAWASTTLIVNVPPIILTHPASQTVTLGQPAQFRVAVSPSTGPTLQWQKNGAAIAGATNANFNIAAVTVSDAGTYSVVATRNGLSATSNNAALTIEVPVSTQPVTHTVVAGSRVQFNFNSTPAPGTTFQWRKDGAAVVGATTGSLVIASATLADAGNYNVVFTAAGVVQTSNTATLIVLPLTPPTITTPPASQTALVGSTLQFRVTASSPIPVTFEWRKNGNAIAGATADTFTINNTQPADAGSYSVVVSNAAGAATSSNASLTVNSPAGIAPTITTHPSSQTVDVGSNVSLIVAATGTAPLAFQWYKDGIAVPGASTALLIFANAQIADEASYIVVVTNGAGIAPSGAADIRVIAPPVIVAQPAAQAVAPGANVEFSVTATGTTPLLYQWKRDGAAIADATKATLLLTGVQRSDAASYSVTVTNVKGTIASSAAALDVAPPSPSARLANVSIRTTLAAGQTVIVGLAIEGGPRDVLVRAVGPALSAFGVASFMSDPRLELFREQTLAGGSDNWPAALSPSFAEVGAFALPIGSRDAALMGSMSGTYSLHAQGTGAGTLLVEAYDIGSANTPRLVNVSARNRVGTGNDVLIAGFTIAGSGSKQLLIRAVGPGLTIFNVMGVLTDPRLELFSSNGARLAENDNWSSTLAPSFSAVGAFGLQAGSRDAALVTALPPGSYTVQVRGADGGTGEAIVEVYELP